jgi:hypothetical protein
MSFVSARFSNVSCREKMTAKKQMDGEAVRAGSGSALQSDVEMADDAFVDYFKCPAGLSPLETSGVPAADEGYFTFRDSMCYGRTRGAVPSRYASEGLADVSDAVVCDGVRLRLPFNLSEVATNLRQERYRQESPRYAEKITASSASRSAYYFLRPILPVSVRRHLQKLRLRGWEGIAFPRWPVDTTVDTLMQNAMALLLMSLGHQKIPFIWFWPDGGRGCAIMTHDVEGPTGRDFCGQLMDLDDSFGIKSAFQIVPEVRYELSHGLCAGIRGRGFEVNVHDLNHDGHLYRGSQEFLERVAAINRYGREFQSRGFRSAAMYRQQEWFTALEFSYDMSVPNVAHLEPQRGGCCTVMPYFVGNILELPLTTIQDYSLFHILGDYSIALWKKQIELILAKNGLISFLSHPDYLIEQRARQVYSGLLAHLRQMRDNQELWLALPGDVDRWWRSRNVMALVQDGHSWRIEGPDSNRARVAYAALEKDHLVFELDGSVVSRWKLPVAAD